MKEILDNVGEKGEGWDWVQKPYTINQKQETFVSNLWIKFFDIVFVNSK